jgi:hypothetical protein
MWDGNTWNQQDVSAYHSPLLQSHALSTRNYDTVNGRPASVTLPTKVAPGDFLVRREIIVLHLAVTLGGAEFYSSCTQIRVGDSQTGTPNQTVFFPGACNDNDPGIYDPSIYSPGAPYTFPGGPVSNVASPADMTASCPGTRRLQGETCPRHPRRRMASRRPRMELVLVLERSRQG